MVAPEEREQESMTDYTEDTDASNSVTHEPEIGDNLCIRMMRKRKATISDAISQGLGEIIQVL